MIKGAKTTIQISRDTWKELNGLRECGESMEDVIRGILNRAPKKNHARE